jgi:hypothetical protein
MAPLEAVLVAVLLAVPLTYRMWCYLQHVPFVMDVVFLTSPSRGVKGSWNYAIWPLRSVERGRYGAVRRVPIRCGVGRTREVSACGRSEQVQQFTELG